MVSIAHAPLAWTDGCRARDARARGRPQGSRRCGSWGEPRGDPHRGAVGARLARRRRDPARGCPAAPPGRRARRTTSRRGLGRRPGPGSATRDAPSARSGPVARARPAARGRRTRRGALRDRRAGRRAGRPGGRGRAARAPPRARRRRRAGPRLDRGLRRRAVAIAGQNEINSGTNMCLLLRALEHRLSPGSSAAPRPYPSPRSCTPRTTHHRPAKPSTCSPSSAARSVRSPRCRRDVTTRFENRGLGSRLCAGGTATRASSAQARPRSDTRSTHHGASASRPSPRAS